MDYPQTRYGQQTLKFNEIEELSGAVENIIFASPDGKFCVFSLRQANTRARATVTLNSEPPLVGQQVNLKGAWIKHPKFGQQFKAQSLHIETPTSIDGIERFLAAGVIKGVGAAMAKRLVDEFGEKTLEVIEKTPEKLAKVAGIGKKTIEKIASSYQGQAELREVMLWLESHNVSGSLAAKIVKKFGSFSLEVLEKDPYRLAREVDGIGFATADIIASASGLAPDDNSRIAAGINYALAQIALNGHCCIPEMALEQNAAKLLQLDIAAVRQVLKNELRQKHLLSEFVGNDTLIYPPYLYIAEKKTADKLRYLKRYADDFEAIDADNMVAEWERKNNFKLAAAQKDAIKGALKYGVFILTGGPGTGKTTVVRGMIDLLEWLGLEILLGAPTGRAAKRLAQTTGRKTMTVHRMLEAQGGTAGGMEFAKDADEQLEADVIILDEVSMMDIVLMQHFLEAVPDGCHVILVGDVDQLPAVGPGSVLKDILRSKVIPSVRLQEIFRQTNASSIVLNAHAINAGRLPKFSAEDFKFVEVNDASKTAELIVDFCTRRIPELGFSPLTDVQVLSPMHRLECGVENLNKLLQAALNPKSPAKAEFTNGTMTFRAGDKVMQTRNNYTKEVFNGDIGFITVVEPDHITVDFGTDKPIDYEQSELTELMLAYAMSVHKSQGSEYPIIVLALNNSHHMMLQKNLLYTAVTRAQKLVMIFGSKAALNTAVTTDRTAKRYTLLTERLREML